MSISEHSRETLVYRIAVELDMPSLYMGGPSLPSRRKAERIVDLLPDPSGAVSALERIRDWELDPDDAADYVWDELRKIAVEVVGPRTSTTRGQ
jgi:hypothetical protein